MTQTIVNLGTAGSALNGQNGSTSSADSNDALFLDWPGANSGNYVYVPPAINSRISVQTGDADITGDLQVDFYWSREEALADRILVSQGTGNTTGYNWRFLILSTGVLTFRVFDGTAQRSISSTEAVPFNISESFWIRITKEAATREVLFYTSSDGVTFTQLGTSVTLPTSATGVVSASDLYIGSRADSNISAGMKFYRLIVRNGIGGSVVVDVDAAKLTSGANTSFTAVTGQTVNLTRSTDADFKTVAVTAPVWLFGADDYITVSDSALLNVPSGQNFTLIALRREWGDSSSERTVASKADTVLSGIATPGYAIWDASAVTTTRVFDGSSTTAPSVNNTNGARELIALRRNNGQITTTVNTVSASSSGVNGDLSNTFTFNIGRVSAVTARYGQFELFGVAFFRRALSDAELLLIQNYYTYRWP